jgi:DNA-binding transcriptional MocR family regulator
MPRFSNPLGISYSNEDKKQILKLAEKYDVYIIEDDYLGDLEIRKNVYPMYYYDVSSKVVYIKSFSKILLPGLRIAAVVLPKVLMNTFKEYKKWMDLNTAVLSQGALEIYIKSGMFKANKKRLIKIYSERMSALKDASKEFKIANVKWHIPDTGFYGCIEFLNGINMNWLINECAKKHICIKDMKYDYLSDYFSSDILKISVGSSGIRDIKNGTRHISKILSLE